MPASPSLTRVSTAASGRPLGSPLGRRSETVNSISSYYSNPNTPIDRTRIGPWLLGNTLGEGTSGRVLLARHRDTDQLAAVKIVDKAELAGDSHRDSAGLPYGIEREITIMKLISHPNILQLYDVWESPTHLFLVLEYVQGGELFDYLIEHGQLTESEAARLFHQIMSGAAHVHRFNIAHRDLKPENLLLDTAHAHIKIADFGMAALETPGRLLETSCGSPHYAAPEIVSGTHYHGPAADTWSCGVILYALLTGTLPFDVDEPADGDESIRALLLKVQAGKFEMPDYVSQEAQHLLSRMLEVDPQKRITSAEVLRHPFFSRYPDLVDQLSSKSESVITRPLTPRELDSAIIGNLQILWHGASKEQIISKLCCPEDTVEKTFYFLLVQYKQRQHSRAPQATISRSSSSVFQQHRARYSDVVSENSTRNNSPVRYNRNSPRISPVASPILRSRASQPHMRHKPSLISLSSSVYNYYQQGIDTSGFFAAYAGRSPSPPRRGTDITEWGPRKKISTDSLRRAPSFRPQTRNSVRRPGRRRLSSGSFRIKREPSSGSVRLPRVPSTKIKREETEEADSVWGDAISESNSDFKYKVKQERRGSEWLPINVPEDEETIQVKNEFAHFCQQVFFSSVKEETNSNVNTMATELSQGDSKDRRAFSEPHNLPRSGKTTANGSSATRRVVSDNTTGKTETPGPVYRYSKLDPRSQELERRITSKEPWVKSGLTGTAASAARNSLGPPQSASVYSFTANLTKAIDAAVKREEFDLPEVPEISEVPEGPAGPEIQKTAAFGLAALPEVPEEVESEPVNGNKVEEIVKQLPTEPQAEVIEDYDSSLNFVLEPPVTATTVKPASSTDLSAPAAVFANVPDLQHPPPLGLPHVDSQMSVLTGDSVHFYRRLHIPEIPDSPLAPLDQEELQRRSSVAGSYVEKRANMERLRVFSENQLRERGNSQDGFETDSDANSIVPSIASTVKPTRMGTIKKFLKRNVSVHEDADTNELSRGASGGRTASIRTVGTQTGNTRAPLRNITNASQGTSGSVKRNKQVISMLGSIKEKPLPAIRTEPTPQRAIPNSVARLASVTRPVGSTAGVSEPPSFWKRLRQMFSHSDNTESANYAERRPNWFQRLFGLSGTTTGKSSGGNGKETIMHTILEPQELAPALISVMRDWNKYGVRYMGRDRLRGEGVVLKGKISRANVLNYRAVRFRVEIDWLRVAGPDGKLVKGSGATQSQVRFIREQGSGKSFTKFVEEVRSVFMAEKIYSY